MVTQGLNPPKRVIEETAKYLESEEDAATMLFPSDRPTTLAWSSPMSDGLNGTAT
jgi:hypothetical protein